MVRRGLKTTVIATVMAMMLAPSFSAFARTGKSNTSGSWQVENNAWVFRNAEGQSVKGWVVYNQEWYYLNPENGQLKTGWLQLDGKWYFLSTEAGAQQGRLLTGWQWIDGYCYYLMPTDDNNYGVLVVNGKTPDGYYVNQSGQWLHGENGDAVYEAGKGLPSAASSQQVAGASRALPGQVLGASRVIAAPGGGSFGGGGGGGSTGGGATASTTGGAGTATAGAATAGTSTGTATGGSAAGTTTPSTEGTGASTGTETTGTENGGNTTEKPGETETPGNPENTTQPGGTTEEPGTENGGNTTEKPGETENSGNSENTTQPGGTTEEKPGTENGGNNAEKPGETENSGNSENTTQPGGTTEEKPGTENGGNNAEKPGETENSGNSENTTQPGGTTEKPGTENGGSTTEKPGETETPGNSENTTQPGGTTEEKPGTENGGNTTEKPGETVKPGNSENTTQPGGTTEEKPGTENGGNNAEKPGDTVTPETSENTTQPEKPVEDSHEEEVSLKDWPFEYRFEYDAEKKSFLLFFGKNEDTKLVKEFLSRNVEVMVNDSHYELGDVFDDLTDAENKYIYALKWDIKERGYYNALRLARSAFHEGDNTVEFAPDGYKPLVFNFKVKRGMLQELKKLEKLQYNFTETVLPGSYDVKIVKFENLSAEQKACITGLKTLEVDGVSYTKVEDQRYEDLCADGRHAFMILNGTWDLAIGNPPKEYATHKISLHPEGYEDIEITYEKLENEPAPVFRKLEKKQGYYELSFQGSREDIQAYLTNIKKLTVAEREFGQMASFHADLLNMGEKYTFGDSEGKKKIEDLLLFSVPTANADKKQEIRIESEGYELNIIPLS